MTPLFKERTRARLPITDQSILTSCCYKVSCAYASHEFLESNKILNDYQHGLRNRKPHHRLAVKLHHFGTRDKNYPRSKVSLHIGINNLSFMGKHLLRQSHWEFHWVQSQDLSCSWYTYPNDLPSRVSSSL